MLRERRERRVIASPSVHKEHGFLAATRFPIAKSGAVYSCNIHDANLFSPQPSHSISSWFSRSGASNGIQWLASSICS